MKFWERKLSRRRLLELGGATLASGYLGRGLAQAETKAPLNVRLGYVLPTPTGLTSVQASQYQVAAKSARAGAIMAGDEFALNASLLGQIIDVQIATAPDTEAAVRAAERLIASDEVFALVGGYGDDTALALSQLAADREVLFFNIGSASDALRGAACNRYTFHVEASAAMYLDALTAWFVRAEFRNWFYVYSDDDAGRALYERAKVALTDRHFGGQEVGSAAVAPETFAYSDAMSQINDSGADVVLLLMDAVSQLSFISEAENAELTAEVTGFPYPVAQTRDFYAASLNGSPAVGDGYRAALWEAKIDAYGARELNARFLERWGMPMDGPAWAAYASVKMLYESASFGGLETDEALAYLEDPNTNFDIYKGLGMSFRPWDHQLRESLYLIKINEDPESILDLANLVGELPALYLPGTDPLERLDQLGDLEGAS